MDEAGFSNQTLGNFNAPFLHQKIMYGNVVEISCSLALKIVKCNTHVYILKYCNTNPFNDYRLFKSIQI